MSRGKYKHIHATFIIVSVFDSLFSMSFASQEKKKAKKQTLPPRQGLLFFFFFFFLCDSLSFIYFEHRYAFSLIFKFTDGVLVAAL